MAAERDRIQAHRGKDSVVTRTRPEPTACPQDQGYCLNFDVVDYAGMHLIGPGGSYWSEMSLVYAYLPSRDGVILFMNAPHRLALKAMPSLVEALDPASLYLGQFRLWQTQAPKLEPTKAATATH